MTTKVPGKISVIIPAYNEELYIEKTLKATLAQSYPDFEVLVVDNNSIDSTAEKVRQIAASDPRVKLLTEKRAGVQFARECARQAATGEFIANLDADCIPPSDWLAKCVAYFADPKVVGLTGPYVYYDSVSLWGTVTSYITYHITRNLLHKFLYYVFGKSGLIGGNAFMRADALEKIGGYNTNIVFYGDDTDTGNRLGQVGKVLFKNNVTVGSSARRFIRFGGFKTTWTYMLNFYWVLIFKRPYKNDIDHY